MDNVVLHVVNAYKSDKPGFVTTVVALLVWPMP